MQFKIQAGATIDVATREEVRDEIQSAQASWRDELSRGQRFRRFAVSGDPAGGSVIVGAGELAIEPDQGFVWVINRLAVSDYDPSPGTDVLSLYTGDVGDSGVIIPKMDRSHFFSGTEIVLYPGTRLVVAGTVAATTRVWVTGQAKEVPVSLAWRL